MTGKFIVKEKMGRGEIDQYRTTLDAEEWDSRKLLAKKIHRDEGSGEYSIMMRKKGETGFTPTLWRVKIWKGPGGVVKWNSLKDELESHVDLEK